MIIRLLANQIPTFWESIKFCATQADEIDKKYLQAYLNEMLQTLLSDKAQCIIRLDKDRILIGLMITKNLCDKITGREELHIQCLYSFSKLSETKWTEDYKTLEKIARDLKCVTITFNTRNKKVMELGRLVGFVEKQRSFILELGR